MADWEQLKTLLHTLNAKKYSFTAPDPEGKGVAAKRVGRKLTFWYVRPFGEAQNAYNEATVDVLVETQATLECLEAEMQDKLAQLQQQQVQQKQESDRRIAALEQALTAELERQKQITASMAADVNRSFAAAAPAARPDVDTPPLVRMPHLGYDRMAAELDAVRRAQNPETAETALQQLEQRYTGLLHDAMQAQTTQGESRSIVLVCREYAEGADMEAIKNEVWDLYRLLKASSRYPVCIVSLVAQVQPVQQTDVYPLTESELADWMRRKNPALLIFCESTVAILNAGQQCMLLRNSIVRLSAQNPAQSMGGSQMQELLHLSDYGIQHYCTASQAAADTMERMGFRRPAVMYPYLNLDKPMFSRRPHGYDAEQFTVGFASSPMRPEQVNSRGIPALCELVAACPEMRFVVLWRDADAVPIPEALQAAPNCAVRTGRCDMAAFYSEIDSILIPYADENYNHACSLSALEGMCMGIPTVATPVSGISELIAQTGLGIVADGTQAADMAAALRQLRISYDAYREDWRITKLRDLVSGAAFVRYAEQCIEQATPYGVCTIYEWDRQLKLENRHLVKGYSALKAYYQRQDIAKNYTVDRFVAYPQNCFDRMERQSVAVLLEQLTADRRHDLRLLDLACGDGRILQTMLTFGHCTAGDASEAMLERVKARFPHADLETYPIDLIADPLQGQYDVITIFRFIRHYEYSDRRMLWEKLRNALTTDGILLFDVPNIRFEVPHRYHNGWGKYNIYDVFWTPESIRRELAQNGLRLVALIPIGQGLYQLPDEFCDEPMTWTAAVCRMDGASLK